MTLEISDLQRVNLQPGDRLVVRFPGRITHQQAAWVYDRLREWAGGDFPVLVLDDGASVEVVAVDAGEVVR